ncbi:MAG: metal-sensitive transcriptional regulator, partial [Candidatus Moranbacteria bacterium]|nr:metal-sensitive transcriptional regulator [Candidatus Moranbacteria bacterium]
MATKKIVSQKDKEIVKEKILNRISRVEGQLKGIRRMVEEQKECIDIITQITAIREAVSMLGIELLKNDFVCNWEDGKKKIDEKYLKSLF